MCNAASWAALSWRGRFGLDDGRPSEYAHDPRPEMVPFVPVSVESVLDVGCYSGAFGELLKSARPGVRVVGIEPNPDAASIANTHLDRVHVSAFPCAELDEKFDAISFNDVLEHLVDPGSALQSCISVLNPGGVVVASLPNVRHYSVVAPLVLRGTWRYKDAGILDRTHLRFFTASSMRDLFEENGFEVLDLQPINVLRKGGTIEAVLRLFGRRSVPFRARQYAIVARPASPSEGSR
jgi:2-polyprenyl-3-methyl-5-hydroxy-6-metoxy-1,4-benzoquinol methylase